MGAVSIGYVFMSIFAPLIGEAGDPLPAVALPAAMAPFLLTVWPPQPRTIEWPPPRVLPEDLIDRWWPENGIEADYGPSR